MTAGQAAAVPAAAVTPSEVPLFCLCCTRWFDMPGFQAHVPCRPPDEVEVEARVFAALMAEVTS